MEALAHFDIAKDKNREDYKIRFNRGLTNASLGDFRAAKEDYEKAR